MKLLSRQPSYSHPRGSFFKLYYFFFLLINTSKTKSHFSKFYLANAFKSWLPFFHNFLYGSSIFMKFLPNLDNETQRCHQNFIPIDFLFKENQAFKILYSPLPWCSDPATLLPHNFVSIMPSDCSCILSYSITYCKWASLAPSAPKFRHMEYQFKHRGHIKLCMV